MIVLILNLYAMAWFSGQAYHLARGTARITYRLWLRYFLLVFLGFAGVNLLALGLASASSKLSETLLLSFAIAIGRMAIVAVPAMIAWIVGMIRRPKQIGETEMFYSSQDGEVLGPFEARQIASYVSNGSLREDVKLCKEGSDQWIEWAEVLTRLRPALDQPNWRNWISERLEVMKQNFKSSTTMNYRIFIPSLALALLVGALLHSWLGERYRVFAAGNGWVMKTDRWTGQTWKCYGSGNSWIPVQEAK